MVGIDAHDILAKGSCQAWHVHEARMCMKLAKLRASVVDMLLSIEQAISMKRACLLLQHCNRAEAHAKSSSSELLTTSFVFFGREEACVMALCKPTMSCCTNKIFLVEDAPACAPVNVAWA